MREALRTLGTVTRRFVALLPVLIAVGTLRERFARGEIDQVEFERRLESLLTTEDASDERPNGRPGDEPPGTAGSVSAREPSGSDGSRARSGDRSSAPGRDREPEST